VLTPSRSRRTLSSQWELPRLIRTSRPSLLARSSMVLTGLIAIFAFFMSVNIASAQQPSSEVPRDLRSYVRLIAESHGFDFAGFCDDLEKRENDDRLCATVYDLKSNSARIGLGQVGEEPTYTLSFSKRGGVWSVTSHNLPQFAPDKLRDAIRALVEGRGFIFTGMCTDFVPPQGAQQVCANITSITGGVAQVTLGPIASTHSFTANFAFKNGSWRVQSHNVPLFIPQEVRNGVKNLVEGRGYQFAGFCAEIDQNRYPGQWCAVVDSLNTNSVKLRVGPVNGEAVASITFLRSNGTWALASHNVPFNITPALRQAVKNLLESRGYEYAGLCAEIDGSRYPGQWCANLVSLTADSARFAFGPVLSEVKYAATFNRTGSSWVVASDNLPHNLTVQLRAAVMRLIQDRGYIYAGLCPEITPSQHPGQWCATPLSFSSNTVQFAIGPAGSNTPYRATFLKSGSSWTVLSQDVPLNVPQQLRDSIKFLLESRGHTFAGLCGEVDPTHNTGRWCATVEVNGMSARVIAGPIGGGATYLGTFAQNGSAWGVISHSYPLNLPQDLQRQIQALIEGRGLAFAGICEHINTNVKSRQVCATVRWQGENNVTVTYGYIGEAQNFSATFKRQSGAWMLASGDITPIVTPAPTTPPATPTPKPPTPKPTNPTPVPSTPTPTPTEPSQPETPTPTPTEPSNPEPTPEPTPAPVIVPNELRLAIANFVASLGYDYVGLCEEVRVGEGATGWCATVNFVGNEAAQVIFGPAKGGDLQSVIFSLRGGQWYPTTSRQPADEDGGMNLGSFVLIGMFGVVASGLGVSLVAARRR
jgi:hypothetical protein